jgi:quercetin dioxygenase-like cupin family protein
MPYAIYDFRHDIKNLFVTPQIRSRFMKLEPGEIAGRHSHDLGHEVFLILQGQCEMEIDGEKAVLTPGQLCVAFNHQMHQARTVGDEPMVMYLSVTPHVYPTHTQYDRATGERLPPQYNAPDAFDQADATAGISTAALADRHLAAVQALAETAQAAAEAQAAAVQGLKAAVASDDRAALVAAMDVLWTHVRASFDQLNSLAIEWNRLAPRAHGR